MMRPQPSSTGSPPVCETLLTTLHRVCRKGSDEDRARFLRAMLTPTERRLVATGLGPAEENQHASTDA
jgi:hypothetical protein